VVISAAVENFARRDLIRQTWASPHFVDVEWIEILRFESIEISRRRLLELLVIFDPTLTCHVYLISFNFWFSCFIFCLKLKWKRIKRKNGLQAAGSHQPGEIVTPALRRQPEWHFLFHLDVAADYN
jgi:hypothetical protein